MRRTKEAAEETRQNLLGAALKVFSQKGFAATRLEDVAEEAGVSRGAIYWHFKNKADLFNTLSEEVSADLDVLIQQAVAEGGTFLEVTRRIMVQLLRHTEEDETFRAVQELTIFKTGYLPELEEGMEKKRQGMRALEAELAGHMRQALAAGEVRADLDPVIAARAYLGYISGLMINWLTDQQAFSLAESAPALVDVFLRGIAAPGRA
ncbi:MAG TPA: TetR family transcriptional regulator [Ktedonobacterales bacterium]|jgi:TetR/AcrR family acrAB operon transcriptional repressor